MYERFCVHFVFFVQKVEKLDDLTPKKVQKSMILEKTPNGAILSSYLNFVASKLIVNEFSM